MTTQLHCCQSEGGVSRNTPPSFLSQKLRVESGSILVVR
jgi:hypothetical protein